MIRPYTSIFVSLILWIVMFGIFSVSAQQSITPGVCYIKDTSESLEEYSKNTRMVIENIRGELLRTPANKSKSKNTLTTRVYNSLFEWNGYETTFEYYIPYSLSNEAPREVKRDLRIIENQKKWAHLLLEYITRSWQKDLIIENACKNIESECWFDNNSIEDIINTIIINTNDVYFLYLNSVLGKEEKVASYKGTSFQLVPENFYSDFTLHYKKENVLACSKEEEWFWYQIKEEIGKIKTNTLNSKEWFKEWQKAIDLASGKTQLSKKSDADTISPKDGNKLQNNYDRYQEEEWLSKNNNPFTNSFNSLQKSVWEQIDAFSGSVSQSFSWNQTSVPLSEIQKVQNYIEIDEIISRSINETYQKNLIFSTIENDTLEDIQARIESLHHHLQSNIKTFQDLKEISTKVCNAQANNKWWNCD